MSDESTVHFPRKLVKQFILQYRDLDCLWNRHSTTYKMRIKRHEAITQLTKLVQSYDPAATRVHVLRKIDSLRACVRREFKKVTDSRVVSKCEADVYVPQLWYYKLFSFVLEQEDETCKKVPSTPPLPDQTAESSDEEEAEADSEALTDDIKSEPPGDTDFVDYTPAPSVSISPSRGEPKKRKRRTEGTSAVDDEYDAIGINVAAKLRHLPEHMRILAEKLIGDVLFQAQTNGLTSASVLVTPDPFLYCNKI